MRTPWIVQMFVTPGKGEPMESLIEVNALAGQGLEGDRYALRQGSYSKGLAKPKREVSLITMDAVLRTGFLPIETRRNLVIGGLSAEELNSLVGWVLCLGEVRLRLMELADPCDWPSQCSGKPGFKSAFQGIGGVRGEILRGGTLRVGEHVQTLPRFTLSRRL